jgi:catechol 2,3-dioxygenase-like lactoylglutathione lyase family enzyme
MLRLTLSGSSAPLTSYADVAAALAPLGVGLWPLELGRAPEGVRTLLRKPHLDESEAGRVRAHFLMPRPRLLEVVGATGRTPHSAGGGALETLDTTHDVPYPELYQVEAGTDYSRFDRFHVNVSGEDGTAVDEFMQVLAGSGVRFLQRLPSGGELALELACPDAASGWLLAYNGGRQHIGSFTACAPGSKILMQIIGPARWVMRYEAEG